MKVLEVNEKLLILLGIFSINIKVPTNQFLKTVNSHLILTTLCAVVVASATHFVKNFGEQENGSDFIIAFIQIVFFLSEIGSFISIGINMTKVKCLHNELQNIVDEGELFQSVTYACVSKIC